MEITSRTETLASVRCSGTRTELVDLASGSGVSLPSPAVASKFIISQDEMRLIVLREGRISVVDRTGTLVAELGRSIERVVERVGILYTVDSDGVVVVWDRDAGTALAQLSTGTKGRQRKLDVSPDGLDVAVSSTLDAQMRLVEWRLPLEQRAPEIVKAEISKSSTWRVERGRLVRRVR
jgi:hypothetical protein